MRRGTPNQLIDELTYKIDQLKNRDIGSSTVIIDDEEDFITADEEIFEEYVDKDGDTEFINEHEEYLTSLYSDVEKEIDELVEGVGWSSDEENIYMDVNFIDGHVFTFTIPKEDLKYDMDNPDMDVEYICKAVRDADEFHEGAEDEVVEAVPIEDSTYELNTYEEDEESVYL